MRLISTKPMLAKPYDNQSIAGWLISEKLDGVRALWTGREFVSRNGNAFAVPAIGAVITFGFCGLTDGGMPRFPTFIVESDYEGSPLVAEQHETVSLRGADPVTLVGQVAGAQAFGELGGSDTEAETATTAGEIHLDNHAFGLEVYGHDLRPVLTAEDATVENIANLEAVDGRRIDDPLAAHDANALGGIGLGQTSGHGVLTRQLGLVFVDDVANENTKRITHFEGGLGRLCPIQNIECPVGEITHRLDRNNLAGILRHPRHRGVLTDDLGLADDVGLDVAKLQNAHPIGIDVDAAHHDPALMTRSPPAGIGNDQHFASFARRMQSLNFGFRHS